MGDLYKILAQVPDVSTFIPFTSLYEVPEPAVTEVGPGGSEVEVSPLAASVHVQTTVTSVIVANSSNPAVQGKAYIAIYDADDNRSFLVHSNVIDAYETKVFDFGLVMGPGEYLKGAVVTATLDFTIMGIETTIGVGPNA